MEEQARKRAGTVGGSNEATPVAWRDLREWLALVEANGQLKRIDKPVDPDEELAAIAYLATRREDAPALMFETLEGDRSGTSILANMLGASKERYALAVGLDPSLSTADMIAASRDDHAAPHQARARAEGQGAGQRDRAARQRDRPHAISQRRNSGPATAAAISAPATSRSRSNPDTGRINVGCYRQMLHGPRRVGLYCSPGKHGLIDRDAWWARGKPCEVVAAYGIDPVLFMLAAQVFGIKESELDVAGGMMGRAVELTEAECVSLPIPANAEFVIEGLLHQGDIEDEGPLGEFTGYYGRERAPQPVIEVKAVHHRRAPILTAALMAKYPSCEIGAYYAIMRSARILDDLDRIGVVRRRRRLCASGRRLRLGHGGGVDAAAIRRPRRAGAGADRAMPGRRLLHQVDHRGGRGRRPDRLQRRAVGAVDALPSGRGSRHPAQHLVDRARSRASIRRRRGPMAQRC